MLWKEGGSGNAPLLPEEPPKPGDVSVLLPPGGSPLAWVLRQESRLVWRWWTPAGSPVLQAHGGVGLTGWQVLSSSLGPRPAPPARVMDSPSSPRGLRGVQWAFCFHVHSGGVSR